VPTKAEAEVPTVDVTKKHVFDIAKALAPAKITSK